MFKSDDLKGYTYGASVAGAVSARAVSRGASTVSLHLECRLVVDWFGLGCVVVEECLIMIDSCACDEEVIKADKSHLYIQPARLVRTALFATTRH